VAAARVQTTKANLSNGVATPWAVPAFGSPVTAGNTIVVFVHQAGSGDIVTGVTDNKGNVYTRFAASAGQNPSMWGYYCANVVGGAGLIISVATSTTSLWAWIFAAEYTGLIASPLDTLAVGARLPGGVTDMTSSPFTTTCQGVVIMAGTNATTATFTAGVDFTLVDGAIQGNGATNGGVEEYVTPGPLVNYTAHITVSVATSPSIVIWIAFKSGPPPTAMFAHGTFRWLQASAVGTVYTIAGLPFQPKALRFYTQGSVGPTNFNNGSYNYRRVIGFATSPSDRRCVIHQEVTGRNPTQSSSGYRDDCVLATINDGGSGATEGRLDLNTLTADGFTLMVDAQIVFVIDANVCDLQFFWEAWGGVDIVAAQTVEIAEPAAAGNQDTTLTGFVAGATDQVLLLAASNNTAAPPTSGRMDGVMMVGAATPAFQWVTFGADRDATTPAETRCYGLSGECLANKALGAGTINARASLVQWNTNGFRLNWLERGVTGRKYIGLGIKGGQWALGEFVLNWSVLNTTLTVSGLPFRPIGLCLGSHQDTESTPDAPGAFNTFGVSTGIGTGQAPLTRRTMQSYSVNGGATSKINLAHAIDQIQESITSAGAIQGTVDLSQVNADGFQVKVTLAIGLTAGWVGYVAFGLGLGALTNLRVGTVTPTSLKVGATTAPKAYYGGTLVWG
jgi:hypothetical protein